MPNQQDSAGRSDAGSSSRPAPEGDDARAAWTQYWNGGNLESLPQDRANGLLAAFDAAWRDFFAELPHGARVVDLATGGGDVIRRALAAGRDFRITGVDFADLAGVRNSLPSESVVLIGNTDISRLPFPDAAFHAVTSQFGIEYGDRAASTRESIRVLMPGGRGRFVMHHADSAITRSVAENLAAHRSVFADCDPFGLARDVFTLHLQGAPQTSVHEAEAKLRTAVDMLHSRLKPDRAFGTVRGPVAFLAELVRGPGRLAPKDTLRRIEFVERDVAARNLRKQAQLDAAIDAAGIERIVGHLAEAGAAVNELTTVKYPGGRVLGWSVKFSRA